MALKNSVRHDGTRREAAADAADAARSVFPPPQPTLKIITAKLFFENGNIDAAPRPPALSLSLWVSTSPPPTLCKTKSEPETDH